MERFDVGEDERLAAMVSAAQAGVDVEITSNGSVVARVVPTPAPTLAGGAAFVAQLREYWKTLPPELTGGDAAAEVRAMRRRR